MAATRRSHDSKSPPTVRNYVIEAEIGQGSFATVYKAHYKKNNKPVAVKSVLRVRLTRKLLENLESEIAILKSLRHDHIVQLVDYQESDTHIHLIMEYCSLGDLSNYIKRRGVGAATSAGVVPGGLSRLATPSSGGLGEYVARHFLKQLASAVEFLRSQNLIHRDIKPQNLLLLPPPKDSDRVTMIGSPDLPILKIADFGFARSLDSTSLAETLCGSPLYMAPEILRYEKYDAKADLWSIGAVLYEMSVGKPPFHAQNHVELLRKIEKGGGKIRFPNDLPANANSISEELKDLIRRLLKRNPVERISFEEFFMHVSVASPLQPNALMSGIHVQPSSTFAPARQTSEKHMEKVRERLDKPESCIHSGTPNSNGNGQSTRQYVRNRSVSSPTLGPKNEHPNSQTSAKVRALANDVTMDGNVHLSNRSDDDFYRDYVVVERGQVEVNALADEFAASPKTVIRTNNRSSRGASTTPFMKIPVGNRTEPTTSPGANLHAFDLHSEIPPFALPSNNNHERAGSAGSTGSASSALQRALSMATERLFGNGSSPPSWSDKCTRQEDNKTMLSGNAAVDPEEEAVVKTIENAAKKAHVIYQFADSKWNQLLPPPPSGSGDINDTPPISPETAAIYAEESLVLYLKALTILKSAMDSAKEYWMGSGEQRADYPGTRMASHRLNNAVQWIRDHFNEILERAEIAKSQCPPDDQQHGIVVERLLYDRALEISRHAAVNELTGEDLLGCERTYQHAICMLNAIVDGSLYEKDNMDDDDRKIVNKFLISINNRLSSLQKKLAQAEQATYGV